MKGPLGWLEWELKGAWEGESDRVAGPRSQGASRQGDGGGMASREIIWLESTKVRGAHMQGSRINGALTHRPVGWVRRIVYDKHDMWRHR